MDVNKIIRKLNRHGKMDMFYYAECEVEEIQQALLEKGIKTKFEKDILYKEGT